jgi:hypothetical protein
MDHDDGDVPASSCGQCGHCRACRPCSRPEDRSSEFSGVFTEISDTFRGVILSALAALTLTYVAQFVEAVIQYIVPYKESDLHSQGQTILFRFLMPTLIIFITIVISIVIYRPKRL